MLVTQPGIEPWPLAVKAQNLNHWTTREFHQVVFSSMENADIIHLLGFYCITKLKTLQCVSLEVEPESCLKALLLFLGYTFFDFLS